MKTIAIAATLALLAAAPAQDKTKSEIDAKVKSLRLSLDFKETPIDQVVDYIREIADINMFVDAKVREKNLQITLKVGDISLGSVLNLMLAPHGCGTLYREGVLQIMTKEDIQDKTVRMQIYDCRDILYPIQHFPGVDLQISADGLGVSVQDTSLEPAGEMPIEELVKAHTGGRSWEENPKCVCTLQNGLLVVKNTPEVHKQIVRLMDMLRAHK